MVWFAVMLAVLGAFCLAIGAQRQGSAVKADTGGLALSSHGMLRLIRSPRWVFGLLLLCLVNPYKIPHESVMQTIELMGTHVIPKFR